MPFDREGIELIEAQQEILDTLRVHCQQGGLCVVVGEPGTGKSVIKEALRVHDPKRLIAPMINRTLHTYHSILRILCEAFRIDTVGRDVGCEKRLIEEAMKINHQGKMLAIVIDDAHLIEVDALRKLRLLLEDFPKNHNLILIGQPELLTHFNLSINQDLKSQIDLFPQNMAGLGIVDVAAMITSMSQGLSAMLEGSTEEFGEESLFISIMKVVTENLPATLRKHDLQSFITGFSRDRKTIRMLSFY